jgi:hypothetical protein
MVEGIAAFGAWVGASLVVLSDARRGLALGIAMAAVSIAVVVWSTAGPLEAAFIAMGGAVAAARTLMLGKDAWGIMPPGSTPRLILCIGAGLLALWIGLGVTAGHSAALRFTVLVALGLAGARVLSSDDSQAQLTAVAVIALAVAAAAGLSGDSPGPWPYAAAAIIAAGAGWLPLSRPRAA